MIAFDPESLVIAVMPEKINTGLKPCGRGVKDVQKPRRSHKGVGSCR